jgi:hypothetical protein
MSKSSVAWSRVRAALGVLAITLTCGTAHAAMSIPWSGTPVNLPGTIQAENYDKGGEGLAFHELTPANVGGRYRPKEAVDIMGSPDGSGFVVTHFDTGEWLVYTVNVPTAGYYDFEVRASAAAPGAAYHLEMDGAPITEVVVVPVTGGWNNYQWVGKRSAYLAAGRHFLTVSANQQYFGLDAIRVTTAGGAGGPEPYTGTPSQVPGTIEAENYDRGGQGISYYDTSAGNTGGQYRNDDMDIMASPDAAGGYIISHFETYEWVTYTINVVTTGNYDIEVRVGSGMPGSALHLRVDGQAVSGVINVPDMGNWNTYQWLGKTRVALTAGVHRLVVQANQPYFGLDAIRVSSADAPSTGASAGADSFSTARKLFSSGFEGGISVSQPTDCWGTGCWLDIVGTDAVTGYSWPANVWGGNGKLLILSDPVVTTPQTIGNYAFNRVESVTGPRGDRSQALFQQITQNVNGTAPMGTAPTQNEFQFLPQWDAGDTYVSYWMKLQPDLVQKMTNLPDAPGVVGGGTWRAIFAAKTGGQTAWGGPADNGDYRIEAYVMTRGGVQPYWVVLGDNNAGGNAPAVNGWSVENRNVPVPVGQWFKFEIFWHRSSGSDGRVWMAVNGQTLADRRGPNMGAWNLPINRIMAPIVYTGSAMPVYQWVDDLEIWDGFPPANGGNQPYAAH